MALSSRSLFLSFERRCWLSIIGLNLAFCGCGSSPSTEQPAESPKPAGKVELPSELPPDAKLLSEGVEVDYFSGNRIRRRQHIRRYVGQIAINHGHFEEFLSDGTPAIAGDYDMGRRVGDWSYWYPNSRLVKVEHFVDGLLDGAWSEFREDGTKREDVSYAKNRRNGRRIIYDETGNTPLREEVYKAGVLEGISREFYPSGKVKVELNYASGSLEGPSTIWYENGKKKREVNYHAGEREGREADFSETGELIFIRQYKNGRLVEGRSD